MPLVDWDFDLLQSLIDDRGDLVIWEKGAPCPQCTEQDPFANALEKTAGKPPTKSSIFCSYCRGDGYIYRDPMCIHGMVTSVMAGKRQLLEMGFAMPGDCTFSPPLTVYPSVSDADRITFTKSSVINEGQVIVRGAAHIGENKQLTSNLAENEDRLWYLADCAILCEDSEGNTYDCDTDFVFDDKKIVWIGNAPPVGRPYVIKYMAFLEWMVYASALERFDNGRDLAPRVMLRKKHVYFLNGAPGDSPAARQDQALEFQGLTRI